MKRKLGCFQGVPPIRTNLLTAAADWTAGIRSAQDAILKIGKNTAAVKFDWCMIEILYAYYIPGTDSFEQKIKAFRPTGNSFKGPDMVS